MSTLAIQGSVDLGNKYITLFFVCLFFLFWPEYFHSIYG